ncbi:MAG TPA: hypothetical protein VGE69_00960 [Pseudomonadales bacterium]
MADNALTRKPALSKITTGNAQLDDWIKKVVEIHEVQDGIRGRSGGMDAKPTFRDLVALGLVIPTRNGQMVRGGAGGLPGWKPGNGGGPTPDFGPPSAPENLTVTGGFSSIYVQWDQPPDIAFLSHAEVWRSGTDNLGTAVLIGTTSSRFYVDTVGSDGSTFYYWARFVKNVLGEPVYGPFNATSGTPGTTAEDPEYIIGQLVGQIQESHLYSALQTRINGIEENAAAIEVVEETVDGLSAEWYVKTDVNGYVAGFGLYNEGPGASGFLVNADNFAVGKFGTANDLPFIIGTVNGVSKIALNAATFIPDATITNAKIQTLAADKIFAASGTIANALIGSAHITDAMIGNTIQSTSYNPNAGIGWQLNKAGGITAANITIRDGSGNIILTSGGSYSSRLDNQQQQWSDVTGTGKPADNATRNNFTYAASAPSSPANGDFYYNTTDKWLYQRVSGVWQLVGTGYTNVGQLVNDREYAGTFNQSTTPSGSAVVHGAYWWKSDTLEMYRYNAFTTSWVKIQGAMSSIDQITPGNVSTYIQSLAVGTLQIANNAVTIPSSVTTTSFVTTTTFNTWYEVNSLTVDYGSNTPTGVLVMATVNLNYSSGSGEVIYECKIMHNGNSYGTIQVSAPSGYALSLVTMAGIVPNSGSNTFTVHVRRISGGTIHSGGSRSMVVLGVRK